MDLSREIAVHRRVRVRVPVEEPVIGSLQLPRSESTVDLASGSAGEVAEHHRDPSRVTSGNRGSRCRADLLDPVAQQILLSGDGPFAEVRVYPVVVPEDKADAPVEAAEDVRDLGSVLEGEVAEVPDDVPSAHHAVP